ncbi:hypothetical protein [Dyadobacter aurulentus]|uniref:hypothetical protein n=1 Tax=Dyadobacter sp. UC 10 TaxID=2605428 RepID=UPI0011F2256B|nr:hypothetical protein [Dyadobacter sp. UC 10]KAA0992038.1 hypothetical protein FXO21_18595 [Dyadobacter sp. UC 10]
MAVYGIKLKICSSSLSVWQQQSYQVYRPGWKGECCYGGSTSYEEIAEQHEVIREVKSSEKSWVQQILDYLGIFAQPESEEEAREYASRQERFTNASDSYVKGVEELMDKVEYVPVLGGISNISEGAVKKDNTQVVLGMASIILDALPGGKAAKGGTSLWTSTSKLSSVKNAFGHWKKHGAEFPEFLNAKQYVEGAKNFMHNSPAGTLMKTRANGDILKYHPGTNTFGVIDASGVPRTMFRPTDGMKYWLGQ